MTLAGNPHWRPSRPPPLVLQYKQNIKIAKGATRLIQKGPAFLMTYQKGPVPENTKRPSVIGHWTNNIYDRLAAGIRPALHSKVKRNPSGKPAEKLTQYLTPEEGKVRLKELLEGTKAIMRISQDKKDFCTKMDVAYPKRNDDNVLLPFSELPRLEKPK
jgi:hypothetical protein